MHERRARRSEHPSAAAQLLLEALAERSGARAVALVDEEGEVLAGAGTAADLAGLSRVAGPPARAEACADFDALTCDTDLYTREVTLPGTTLYLCALGQRMRRFHEAATGLARILSA